MGHLVLFLLAVHTCLELSPCGLAGALHLTLIALTNHLAEGWEWLGHKSVWAHSHCQLAHQGVSILPLPLKSLRVSTSRSPLGYFSWPDSKIFLCFDRVTLKALLRQGATFWWEHVYSSSRGHKENWLPVFKSFFWKQGHGGSSWLADQEGGVWDQLRVWNISVGLLISSLSFILWYWGLNSQSQVLYHWDISLALFIFDCLVRFPRLALNLWFSHLSLLE